MMHMMMTTMMTMEKFALFFAFSLLVCFAFRLVVAGW
jgi:hypothetical protein